MRTSSLHWLSISCPGSGAALFCTAGNRAGHDCPPLTCHTSFLGSCRVHISTLLSAPWFPSPQYIGASCNTALIANCMFQPAVAVAYAALIHRLRCLYRIRRDGKASDSMQTTCQLCKSSSLWRHRAVPAGSNGVPVARSGTASGDSYLVQASHIAFARDPAPYMPSVTHISGRTRQLAHLNERQHRLKNRPGRTEGMCVALFLAAGPVRRACGSRIRQKHVLITAT